MPGGPAYVIVGASLAGAKAAETLREEGFDGTIALVGQETERPYERPPLSKGFLLGKAAKSSIYVHEEGWYAGHGVNLLLGSTVTAIDRAGSRVELADGSAISYDRLLLTMGASPRTLDVPGGDLGGVRYLRTAGDSERLGAALADADRVVIAGAGWIGLEVAAAAREQGCEVTVAEPEPGALHRSLGPELGGIFADLHRAHGVTFRFGEGVSELRGSGGRVAAAITSSGAELPADLVVVGIGAVPNTALATVAGLDVDNGILVDAALRTSDPAIWAAGDVVNAFNPLLGRRIRVEHWANALNGGPAAARSMLGQEVSYDRVPYFYSDQYELGMETCGLPEPGRYDQIVYRGDTEGLEFIAFWLASGAVVAGMNVNVWDVTDDIQELIRSGRPVDTARLADPDVPLAEV
ncbi:MAG: 3-phenylpropionate/trans-cinnamate dioxygenase ferredoxin reductase component [Streptosporangiaceae bacterium]|jgi:3-phenylpropionate/trans-cinnamate dioxygenase ferredoxin reductase subunit|nr:3-phenylpropionate/trans-cinnamate dioxygenase ferredoxin reductase component [Streptosporangiaceae bacterium]